MKKTKFVTSYYMDVTEFTNGKWIGSASKRKQRYLGSLIYHCKNFPNYSVVCYTHKINFNEIEELKKEYNLVNMEIKVKELDEIKYTLDLDRVVAEVPDYMERFGLPGRPPQVMWGKFDIVRQECTEDFDYVYWIDAGLQSFYLFPLRYNKYKDDVDFWTNLSKIGDFGNLFNEQLINKLSSFLDKRFVNIGCQMLQSYVYSFEDYEPQRNCYPIGGFFGGYKDSVLKYCDIFDDASKKHLDKNLLCFEDSIMKQVMDRFPQENLYILNCDVHSTGVSEDDFHKNEWDPNKGIPVPIWRVWEIIRDEL